MTQICRLAMLSQAAAGWLLQGPDVCKQRLCAAGILQFADK